MYKVIKHYGTPRRSGRYPWGSGEDPQRSKDFNLYVNSLKKQGMKEVDIAKGLGMNTSQLRATKSLARAEKRNADAAQALKLKDKGYSTTEIGRRMGMPESTIRSLLNPAIKKRTEVTNNTAEMLKKEIEKKKYIDVGVGVENRMSISRTKLKTAVEKLKNEEGYTLHYLKVEQVGTGKPTSLMVLAAPNTSGKEVYANRDNIGLISHRTIDGGKSWLGLKPIEYVDSKRIGIKYAEEGGGEKDGVIELRRGVKDLSLGDKRYAQVRIGVDGTHFLKGMAMYSDDMPDGVDIIYNTNKHKGTPKEKVFKELKRDKEGNIDKYNPFGSTFKREINDLGESVLAQRGALNIVNEEGDWGKWSKTLSSQMLSKQSIALAKKQLNISFDERKKQFDEINSLTNPVVRKKLLNTFADDCDSAATHLKAAALPRQASHVILPFPNMKENEIYAPNYKNGEQVVLIRYPHGGTFEIPQLRVNNKHKEARSLLGNALDAVGINPRVAERLSGADFDGDTVLVIPNNKGSIKTTSPLKGLADFNTKEKYPPYDGMRTIDGGIYNEKLGKPIYKNGPPITATKQRKMGDVSNLISDMTIKGANQDEIARAVRHSMVVIDSEKHALDYKRSYVDNGIAGLKKKYQGSERAGASTLISKAASEERVNVRKEYVDPLTGKKVYKYTGETYKKVKYKDPITGKIKETTPYDAKKKGYSILSEKEIKKTTKSTKMYETEDAFTLSSGTFMEATYADYANKLKSLANNSRLNAINIPRLVYSPSAKKVYEKEVASLNAQLNIAIKNKPLERQAQILANSIIKANREDNPHMSNDELKKLKQQALAEARVRTGAKKKEINVSNREWEAIQAGAISNNKLIQILDNTDLNRIKQLATPLPKTSLSASKIAKAKSMIAAGRTQAEIAEVLGISTSTLAKALS